MKAAACALAVLALLVGACGGSEEEAPTAADPGGAVVEDGAEHIHGLGVNPRDGSLVIATHSGLFEAAPGERRAARIGDRRQDTMGFTVVGADRFLGSGHPDARDDLPPLLGLIRSDDGGRAWEPVSLLGEADFHVLRTAGDRIYGVNSADGLLFVSDDGGRRWARRTPPGAVVDLAADPRDPDRVVVSTEDALHVTRNAGDGWRPLARRRAGLLAWPAPDALVLVDATGAVHRSADAGRSWDAAGRVGGRPAAFAAHGGDLYVALHTNEVRMSRDGGRTWAVRVAA